MTGLENVTQRTRLRAREGDFDPVLAPAHRATTYSLVFAF